ncbi:MAG: hypothetical protein IPJ81_16400 [Chitinophagaceae bacterium]|nr:hypothetical protein [Chitinophagaceae bacterium]
MLFTKAYLLLVLILSVCISQAQHSDSIIAVTKQLPEKYISQIVDKVDNIDKKLSKQTLKALKKFERQEAKLKRKLIQKDSTAKELFAFTTEKINQLQGDFTALPDKAVDKFNGEYNAYLDTLKSTFKFLQQDNIISKSKLIQDKLKATADKINILEDKFQKAEEIKKYLRERREILKQQLERFGMIKQLKKLDKNVYYYSQYINEYKNILKDRKRLEQKAMVLLYKIPAFKKFIVQNSWLSSIFNQNSNIPTLTQTELLQGIQSRVNVQQNIQSGVAAGGPNASQIITQQLQLANSQLNKLKEKISNVGGDGEIPSTFKPNSQKTKRFKERLEYGGNIQFEKSANYFPTTGDIAFTLGYKLSDNKMFGIGAGYKIGLGKDIRNIQFTSEGVSLRSYLDVKLKGQFFVSGGYEQTYFSRIKNVIQLQDYSAWSASGLLGVSRKYQLTKKAKGKAQILYNFLNNSSIPKTSPIVFRIWWYK